MIEGGINTNVVPDRVTLSHRPAHHSGRIAGSSRGGVARADRDRPLQDARVSASRSAALLLSLPLVKLPGAERLTRALQTHGEDFFGTPIAEHGVPIYTDARHYTAAGIPTVLYGAGPRTLAEANGHAADEKLRLEDLRRATKTVASALADLLGASD